MSGLSIGIVYELHDTYPSAPGAPVDAHVEYEPEATVAAIEAAFAHLGHRPVRIGSPHALLAAVAGPGPVKLDAVLPIAEGYGTRNREAWAPVLAELAHLPALGSDALTLSLTLDKEWALRHAAVAGVPTAPHRCFASAAEAETAALPAPFPLFVKPRWEGTAKGIRASSRVASRAALAREVARIAADYDQPALVEAFVPGPEYTVTVVGNDPPRALPVLQRALERGTGIGVHALEGPGAETDAALPSFTPGQLTPELEAELARLSLAVYAAFECRDFARLDFRLNASGAPVFLEINPLPTFAPDASFGILAELEGRPVEALLADVFRAGLVRLGLEAP
ncbi:MAG: D-alanine--D-alanine ligase [Proteobacteria bacterium]|nr:D-alanine--D-alanine ligase [Pseudomonadota bacterium]